MPEPQTTLESEYQLLGMLLLDGRDVWDAVAKCISSPLVFKRPLHRDIYSAMKRVFESGKQIDILTVNEEMRSSSLNPPTSSDVYYLTELTMNLCMGGVERGAYLAKQLQKQFNSKFN